MFGRGFALGFFFFTISQIFLHSIIQLTIPPLKPDFAGIILDIVVQPRFIVVTTLFTCYTLFRRLAGSNEERGSQPNKFIRSLPLWYYLARYFPVSLVASDELREYARAHSLSEIKDMSDEKSVKMPLDRNYLVGCHPHGIFSTGAFLNFSTDATGFSDLFPGINRYLAVLKLHFLAVLYRDFVMRLETPSANHEVLCSKFSAVNRFLSSLTDG
ncbi:unnamed protein product [Protopolystoma xenopodis]|uniref:Acyltransferase n=1 Tax=Protopolystoma xenopodis TaxID=117903 RepID=A0A448XAQ9_9PLAT|nr:unnamed protein product [Protopolystoma xenopodis]